MYPSADAIFDILVARSGADEADRGQFHADWPHCAEFKFQGLLGPGGKIWYGGERNPPRVSCYREDESTERQVIIEDSNKALMELWLATVDAETAGFGRFNLDSMRSLVVDENPENNALLRHYLRDAAEQIESAPRDMLYRWRSDDALKARLAQAIRGGCPEIFEGIYEDFPALIVDSVFDVLDAEARNDQ